MPCQPWNTYLSSSLVISCESLSVMNFRENHMSSKVLPAELIPFFIIGRALSIQRGSVITTNARMNNKKNKKICFEFIKKRKCPQ